MPESQPLVVDGSAGGGQVLRTALSLAAVTGRAVDVDDVRGSRPAPGLHPQHLACVECVAAACDATVEGAELESPAVAFDPGPIGGGDLRYDLPTAGSVSLLFDALLPLAVALDAPLTVTATGGTDVKWSPPLASLQHVKLPLLARVGLDATVTRERTGFYPAGGGKATLTVRPSTLSPLSLTERGPLERVAVHSRASASLAGAEVADRQANAAAEALSAVGFSTTIEEVAYDDTASPGSSLLLVGEYGGTRLGVDALGERGKPSEAVAADAVEAFEDLHEAGVVLDPHLADQLLVFLALAGGDLLAPAMTDHLRTNCDVLSAFGYEVTLEEHPDGTARVHSAGERSD
ncbi:RNA 3'-terminal phosphate cyclase [Halomarina ordinaria]|uniref:RNA 3'-terminal phosphate cyclase n=1 Tax=Halomarina ordinaria TaxID=3033939 RepID=A0ABD5U6J7_9EURY|nr:RNA 3'-terminal phosphate cyclase [Halomarina sp. PSRA2]